MNLLRLFDIKAWIQFDQLVDVVWPGYLYWTCYFELAAREMQFYWETLLKRPGFNRCRDEHAHKLVMHSGTAQLDFSHQITSLSDVRLTALSAMSTAVMFHLVNRVDDVSDSFNQVYRLDSSKRWQ